MNVSTMTDLEKGVLMWLLAGDDPVIVELQKQLSEFSTVEREHTGHGFYLNFEPPPNLRPIHSEIQVKANFCFGDVEAIIPSLENGAGFLLRVDHGIIHSLEGYTYGEVWPEEINEFKLRYIFGPDRDWVSLRKEWELKHLP